MYIYVLQILGNEMFSSTVDFIFNISYALNYNKCILIERTNTIKKYRVYIIWLQLICHKFRKPSSRNEYIKLCV